MPRLSVLLPCYNASRTLADAIFSLNQQTMKEFEVIAVDDGSTDGTVDILEHWAKVDRRVNVIRQAHQGIVVALNTGLQNCSSPFTARMDCDDSSMPRRFEKQLDYLMRTPKVAVVSCLVDGYPGEPVQGGYRHYFDWLNSLIRHTDIVREIFIESPLAHPSVVYRTEQVLQVGGYQDRGWAEDYDLWLRLYLNHAKFGKVPEILFAWRDHPGRLTRTDPHYSLENFLRAKAYYLVQGPLADRDGVFIWGAGMVGRRLSKHLQRQGAPLVAFLDISAQKIGGILRGLPIHAPKNLLQLLNGYAKPVVLASVGSPGARLLIRKQLNDMGLAEGEDWWCVA